MRYLFLISFLFASVALGQSSSVIKGGNPTIGDSEYLSKENGGTVREDIIIKKRVSYTGKAQVINGDSPYNALDVSGSSVVQCGNETVVINGLANGTVGQIIHIYASSSGANLTLTHASGSAVAENQILNSSGNIVLTGYSAAILIYTGSRWLAMGVNP